MTIPLDRLYHYIDKLTESIYGQHVIIYRFSPHGSKKLIDFSPLAPPQSGNWLLSQITQCIYCADQEPLDFELLNAQILPLDPYTVWYDIRQNAKNYRQIYNLNVCDNIFQYSVLLHSEQRSDNLRKYLQPSTNPMQNQLLSVYYWSHAIISRDWFRYAQHETFDVKFNTKFLIYNRAWSGTREYRLKFTDLLIEQCLIAHCKTFCNPIENGTHYRDHQFKNLSWKPVNEIEHYVKPSHADTTASADYCVDDYNSTGIEVVLETLFDDNRLHLTEKSLRPIACRQPFVLLAPHGSLQYLKDYGFITYETVWDETYDKIEDPMTRMHAVIQLMTAISSWTVEEKIKKLALMEQIAIQNQHYFFSQEFSSVIISELKNNLTAAFDTIKKANFEHWIDQWNTNLKSQEIRDFLKNNKDDSMPTQGQLEKIFQIIKCAMMSINVDQNEQV